MAATTLKGNSVDLKGRELKVGDDAPDFKLQDNSLAEVTLASSTGKTRIIATIPSLDTPVCHAETKRFNDGHELGLGAEIGISTDKLHARGPMALRELTSYKYLVRGEGQVR